MAVVAAGGALGACARYGAALAWPTPSVGFPWTTLWVNTVGCVLMGVLMVVVTEARPRTHPLVRPFLGTGILGGFTTFSTYAVDFRILSEHRVGPALAYLAGTVVAALLAVAAGTWAARRVFRGAGAAA